MTPPPVAQPVTTLGPLVPVAPDPEAARRLADAFGGRGSLKRTVSGLLVAIVLLALVTVSLGVSSLRAVTAEQRSATQVTEPALAGARGLLVAMVEQETSVRGYLLTVDPTFVEAYRRATGRQAEETARLRRLLRGRPDRLGAVGAITAAADEWQARHAEQQIRRTDEGDPTARLASTITFGKGLFDRIRSALDRLDEGLRTDRLLGDRRLASANDRLRLTLGATVGVLLLVVLAVTVVVRRSIVRPLDQIGGDVEAVIGGDLGHAVEPAGPREIADLGMAVEAMRLRVVAQLEAVEAAKREAQERAQDLARSNAELEQFAYVASHDLQEPLRKVASFCQLLQKRYGGQLDERADQYIEFAVDGAKRMQGLISDLLSFSRVGRTTETFVPVALSRVVTRVQEDLAELLADTGATVEVDGELPSVPGDPGLLAALFQNLVANAVKFRRPGVAPVVRIRSRTLEDGVVEVTVEDEGIGIEPRFAERVFVIFQRLHGRDEYEGTGIGLAMCRKIVEFHGGRIWVDVERGDDAVGTAISFTLPTRVAPRLDPPPALPALETT